MTSLKIAEELATSRKGQPTTVVVLVPSLQLLNQTLREWKQESEIPFRAFAVCSDTKVGKSSTRTPSEDMSVVDLVVPATTVASRLYVGAHLPLDVVGGAALGLLSGSLADLAARFAARGR